MHDTLPFIPIGDHSLYPVHIRTEAAQLDLLTLACLDRQWIRVYPLVGRHISRVMSIGQYVEDSGIVDDREKSHRGDDLF